MANMSYCRFENTNQDIKDCINALEERNISSQSEKRAAMKMLQNVLNYCLEESIINHYDFDRLKEVIAECKEQDDE